MGDADSPKTTTEMPGSPIPATTDPRRRHPKFASNCLRDALLIDRFMSERKMTTDSQTEFDQLQNKLVPLWKSIERFNQDPQTIVVVPSMSIDAIGSGAVMQAYEERFLFLLL